MKKCGRCREWLPLEMFGLSRWAPDGLNYVCRDCRTASVNPKRSLRLEHGVAGTDHLTLGETIALKPQRRDRTLPKVYKALWYWVSDKTLSEAQASAIVMIAIDGLNWSEAGRIIGVHHTTVRTNYFRGIHKLRQRDGAEEQEVAR